MFREIFRGVETDIAVNYPKPDFKVAEKYQVKCSPQEAIAQLAELQLRKAGQGYDSALDYQISTITKVITTAISKSQVTFPENEFSIIGELWESPRGLTNLIIDNIGHETTSWQTRSWMLRLLECKYDYQKHLEKASKLGLIENGIDPYVLREALMGWKENDSSP